ncbi:hypothetical protein CLU94_0110 [Janthinobacterium sp. 13]|nr:hypothetical protein CLU94_0110 [Janthinobacterium sp. 13]
MCKVSGGSELTSEKRLWLGAAPKTVREYGEGQE